MAAPPEVNATEPSDELIYIKKLSLPSVLLKHQADAVNDVGRARHVLTILMRLRMPLPCQADRDEAIASRS
jgi:hypothetical protein